ncbi:hypothetical protein DID78_04830 [Candidatus Marinamargulisbacteria bacterium SCGC AG-343-D04]|nr:hypothetical protein DID78_04830 [Candidatus Marinamargulisbacteria bacterium SCGC AG-343-D04]
MLTRVSPGRIGGALERPYDARLEEKQKALFKAVEDASLPFLDTKDPKAILIKLCTKKGGLQCRVSIEEARHIHVDDMEKWGQEVGRVIGEVLHVSALEARWTSEDPPTLIFEVTNGRVVRGYPAMNGGNPFQFTATATIQNIFWGDEGRTDGSFLKMVFPASPVLSLTSAAQHSVGVVKERIERGEAVDLKGVSSDQIAMLIYEMREDIEKRKASVKQLIENYFQDKEKQRQENDRMRELSIKIDPSPIKLLQKIFLMAGEMGGSISDAEADFLKRRINSSSFEEEDSQFMFQYIDKLNEVEQARVLRKSEVKSLEKEIQRRMDALKDVLDSLTLDSLLECHNVEILRDIDLILRDIEKEKGQKEIDLKSNEIKKDLYIDGMVDKIKREEWAGAVGVLDSEREKESILEYFHIFDGIFRHQGTCDKSAELKIWHAVEIKEEIDQKWSQEVDKEQLLSRLRGLIENMLVIFLSDNRLLSPLLSEKRYDPNDFTHILKVNQHSQELNMSRTQDSLEEMLELKQKFSENLKWLEMTRSIQWREDKEEDPVEDLVGQALVRSIKDLLLEGRALDLNGMSDNLVGRLVGDLLLGLSECEKGLVRLNREDREIEDESIILDDLFGEYIDVLSPYLPTTVKQEDDDVSWEEFKEAIQEMEKAGDVGGVSICVEDEELEDGDMKVDLGSLKKYADDWDRNIREKRECKERMKSVLDLKNKTESSFLTVLEELNSCHLTKSQGKQIWEYLRKKEITLNEESEDLDNKRLSLDKQQFNSETELIDIICELGKTDTGVVEKEVRDLTIQSILKYAANISAEYRDSLDEGFWAKVNHLKDLYLYAQNNQLQCEEIEAKMEKIKGIRQKIFFLL